MARKRGQDNLGDILILANRKAHAQVLITIESQKQVIYFMKGKPRVTRKELEKELGLQFSHLAEDNTKKKEFWRKRKKFYKIMSPLIGTVIVNDRENLTYELNGVRFGAWFDSLKRTGKEVFG